MPTTVSKTDAPKVEAKAAAKPEAKAAEKTEATQAEQLRAQAAQKREQAARLVEQAASCEALATNIEAVFSVEIGTKVSTTRRNGDLAHGTFQGAKDTGRGILVAVQVGEGFEAEVLKLPLSKVTFESDSQADPLAGVDAAE